MGIHVKLEDYMYTQFVIEKLEARLLHLLCLHRLLSTSLRSLVLSPDPSTRLDLTIRRRYPEVKLISLKLERSLEITLSETKGI